MLRVRHQRDHAGGPPIEAATVADGTVVLTLAWGRCTIRAADDALVLVAEAGTHDDLARIQHGVGQRVARIGRRDGLTVRWAPTEGEIAAEDSPAASLGRHRGALTAVALVLLALVVAVHLGIGAALVRHHWAWWALAAIAVLVLLKLVVARHVLASLHSRTRGG